MEISSDNGLTVTFDDETNIITLDWCPETHPEYNIFEGMTSEEFCTILLDYADKLTNEKATAAEVPAWGSSCGTTQSDSDSRTQSGEHQTN